MPIPIGTSLPALSVATGWLNGTAENAVPIGQPLLVQFWAISCPICKMNLPRLQQLERTYAAHGLRLVSIHMPRMEADMDTAKVQEAMTEMGLTGPCAIDNAHTLGDRFQTGGVWPCYFLFDAQGKLRSRAAGALGLKMAENSLKRMLGVTDNAMPNDSVPAGAAP